MRLSKKKQFALRIANEPEYIEFECLGKIASYIRQLEARKKHIVGEFDKGLFRLLHFD